jgi:hypothetical protein
MLTVFWPEDGNLSSRLRSNDLSGKDLMNIGCISYIQLKTWESAIGTYTE